MKTSLKSQYYFLKHLRIDVICKKTYILKGEKKAPDVVEATTNVVTDKQKFELQAQKIQIQAQN